MTKERLYHESDEDYKAMLDIFFESNVCIPKGQSRHKYADVLHECIEDTTIELEHRVLHYERFIRCYPFGIAVEYRIKPSEPVWEYQYLITTMFGASENKLSKFITDDEFESMARSRSEDWIKIEETKRERR